MSRPPLQFTNVVGQTLEITTLIQQTSTQPDDVRRRRRDAFAEPQCSGVILFRVINWLKRLRTNALYIP